MIIIIIVIIIMIDNITLLSLFWKIKEGLCDHLAVCVPPVARQQLGKNDTATNTYAAIEQLLDAMFSRRAVSDPSSCGREGPSPKHEITNMLWWFLKGPETKTVLAKASSNLAYRPVSSSQNFLLHVRCVNTTTHNTFITEHEASL
jgi:hypothetical protein